MTPVDMAQAFIADQIDAHPWITREWHSTVLVTISLILDGKVTYDPQTKKLGKAP